MDKKRLVILSDYGLDDACATAMLLKFFDRFSGIDIVAIGGNTSSVNSLNNAKKLLVALSLQKDSETILKDVRLVDTTAISQFFCTLPSVHGVDGMGDLYTVNFPLPVPLIPFSEWLDSILTKDILLFSVGPCTITKLILQKIPKLELVIMAGVIDEVPNYKGYEFNQGLDVEAFDFCVKYPHVIATLDSCRAPIFNLAGYDVKSASVTGLLVAKAISLAIARHKDNCYIYDLIAAKYILSPEMFTLQQKTDKWGNKLNNLVVNSPNKTL